MLPVEAPYKTYTDLDGKPLDNGYVYFGLPNQNPITSPITVYWDAAGTIPAAQPLRTVDGYIIRGGTPANVFTDQSYSELALDHKKRQVFLARDSKEFSLAYLVGQVQSDVAALNKHVDYVVPSMAALLALDSTKYATVRMLGYYAPGDGGGGDFYLVSTDTTTATNGGSVVLASPVGRWKLIHNGTASVEQFGALAGGATDCLDAFNRALGSEIAIIYLSPTSYRVSGTINVPAYRALKARGSFGAFYIGQNNDSHPSLIGDLAVTPIVSISSGAIAQGTTFDGIMVTRAPGTVPGGSIGVAIHDCTGNMSVQDILSIRSAIGFKVGAGSATSLGIHLLRCVTGQVTEFHVRVENAVETTFTECRFGRNGGVDVACYGYVNVYGAVVDTLRFQTCQFNQSGALANTVVSFTLYDTNPNGDISFMHCHMESWTFFVALDDTSKNVRRLRLVGNTISGGTTTTFYYGPPGKLIQFMAASNLFDGGMTLTLDQHVDSVVTGNNLGAAVTFNQGSQVVSNNLVRGNLKMQGATTGTVCAYNLTFGNFVNTMTGTTSIVGNI